MVSWPIGVVPEWLLHDVQSLWGWACGSIYPHCRTHSLFCGREMNSRTCLVKSLVHLCMVWAKCNPIVSPWMCLMWVLPLTLLKIFISLPPGAIEGSVKMGHHGDVVVDVLGPGPPSPDLRLQGIIPHGWQVKLVCTPVVRRAILIWTASLTPLSNHLGSVGGNLTENTIDVTRSSTDHWVTRAKPRRFYNRRRCTAVGGA